MNFLVFTILVTASATCCLHCSNSDLTQCLTCNPGYYKYKDLICLNQCPSTYSVSASLCLSSDPANQLFSLNFYEFTNINARSFSGFSSNFRFRFNNFKANSLIPTVDRGFLSTSVSVMVGDTAWVPAPDMTFQFWVFPTYAGVIFEVLGSSMTALTIGVNTNYTLGLRTFKQVDGLTAFDSFLSEKTTLNAWDYVSIKFSQTTQVLVEVVLALNGVEKIYSMIDREAKFNQLNTWSFGSLANGNAFKGFLYQFRAHNQILSEDLTRFDFISCSAASYFDGFECKSCSSGCDWNYCKNGSCSICNDCKYCEGYSKNDCSCGGSTCCQRGCLKCPDFYTCVECDSGYSLTEGDCVADSPFINIKFNGDFAGYYGRFRTGNDGTRFYFKNNPEATDPIPAQYRGLYFTGGKFLLYEDTFVLNYDFSLALWMKYSGGGLLNKGALLQFDSNRLLFIYKYTLNNCYYQLSSSNLVITDIWTHLSISFNTEANSMTFNIYLDNVLTYTYSSINLVFEDIYSDSLVLGKSTSSNYEGFIYSFKLWKVYLQDFAYEYLDEICGESLSSACLSECPMNYYLLSTCKPCSTYCEGGCVDTRSTCTICSSYLCQYCDNYDTTVCLECISNASGQPCRCNDGFYDLNYLCNACYPRCQTCSSLGFGCLTCQTGFVYCQSLCLVECPTGYLLNSGICSKSNITALEIDLRNTFELGLLQSFRVGLLDTNQYPVFDENDPIPVVSRGFYFTPGKFISGSLVFSPTLSLSLWVKVVSSGSILKKTGILGLTALSSNSVEMRITLMNGNQIIQTSIVTNWVLLSYSLMLYNNYQYSKMTTSINNVVSSTKDILGFVSDVSGQPTSIGLSFGFTGFIATVHVFTDSSQNTTSFALACTSCSDPSCPYCLSSCEFSQDPADSCKPCPSSCTLGCRAGTCNLCGDHLCKTCSDRKNLTCINCTEHSSGSPCTCEKFYFNVAEFCLQCYKHCKSCKSQGFLCEVCNDGMVMINYFCIKECPTGYQLQDGKCLGNFSVVFNLDLSDLIQLGKIGGFIVGNDSNNTFPEYDLNDPWPSYKRGYYFHEQAYMNTSCILSPNFTLTLWFLGTADGVLVEKVSENSKFIIYTSNSSILANISLQGDNSSLSFSYNSSIWTLFSLSLYTSFNVTSLLLFQANTLVKQLNVPSYYLDTNSSFYITPRYSFNNFTGFMWRAFLVQVPFAFFANTSIPFSNCSILHYPGNSLNPNDCQTCPSSCGRSCANNSCNICPDKLCLSCSSFTRPCDVCKNNSSLVNQTCDCNLGFYSELESCHSCYKHCKDCSFKFMNSCTLCPDNLSLLSEGICGACGLGFNKSKPCVLNQETIFNLEFNNTVKGVIFDSINGFEVVTGKSSKFYPEYEEFDPYVAFLRGFYFNGKSSYMSVSSQIFILPHAFQVRFWINPTSSSGVVFMKGDLVINLNLASVNSCINLTEGQVCYTSPSTLPLKSWSKVVISFEFSSELTTISFGESFVSGIGYYIDNSTAATFGKGLDVDYLEGFLFTFSINSGKAQARTLLACLESCSECLDSGYCIPTCLISEFWTGPAFNDCQACKSECGTGCRSSETCSLCADEKCKSCDSLEINTECTGCFLNSYSNGSCECQTGFNWNPVTLECFSCDSNQYLHNLACVDCPDLCLTCSDNLNCLTCSSNATTEGGICYCKVGYLKDSHSSNVCLRHVLNISLIVDLENQGSLVFNESLKYELKLQDIQVEVPGDVSLDKYSDRFYKIKVDYSDPVDEGEIMIVKLLSNRFVSITNATPETLIYQGSLFKSSSTVNAAFEAAKQLAQTVTTAVTSAVTATSMMNPNPACLWSFINTVQMIVFIILANVSIPSKSKGLIVGLKNYNFFPNTFEYFMPEGEPHNFQNAYDLGYKSDSVMVNIGRAVTAFMAFMVLWVVLLMFDLMIKKGWCTRKLFVDNVKEFLADYKYGFFIRFGITNYIEFEIAALIGIINFDQLGTFSIINTVISSVILIVLAATPALCFWMVAKRRAKRKEEQEEFDTMYGTLFYEFNNDQGVMTSNFYVLFFLKRATYGMILMLLRGYGVIQMTLILILSFSFLIYLIIFKPFGEKIINFSNIFSEVATLLIFVLITWLLFDMSDKSLARLDNVIYYLVYIIMGIQMCASISLMVKTIKSKIAAKLSKSKTTPVLPISSDEHEDKNLNPVSNSNEVSRLENIDEVRSKKTASGLSKYGKFFEDS